jgi:hypothetical protein
MSLGRKNYSASSSPSTISSGTSTTKRKVHSSCVVPSLQHREVQGGIWSQCRCCRFLCGGPTSTSASTSAVYGSLILVQAPEDEPHSAGLPPPPLTLT